MSGSAVGLLTGGVLLTGPLFSAGAKCGGVRLTGPGAGAAEVGGGVLFTGPPFLTVAPLGKGDLWTALVGVLLKARDGGRVLAGLLPSSATVFFPVLRLAVADAGLFCFFKVVEGVLNSRCRATESNPCGASAPKGVFFEELLFLVTVAPPTSGTADVGVVSAFFFFIELPMCIFFIVLLAAIGVAAFFFFIVLPCCGVAALLYPNASSLRNNVYYTPLILLSLRH